MLCYVILDTWERNNLEYIWIEFPEIFSVKYLSRFFCIHIQYLSLVFGNLPAGHQPI